MQAATSIRGILPRLLYFTASAHPTPEEAKEYRAYGAMFNCVVRAAPYDGGDNMEVCDAVAGSPPARYRKKYPSAADYISPEVRDVPTILPHSPGAGAFPPPPEPASAAPAATEWKRN